MYGEGLHVFLLEACLGFLEENPRLFSFLLFICFQLSLQTGEFQQSCSPYSDAGYLLVAAAGAEHEGGACRLRLFLSSLLGRPGCVDESTSPAHDSGCR